MKSFHEQYKNQIKDLAEQDDRSFSQYINIVLKEYVHQLTEAKNEEV